MLTRRVVPRLLLLAGLADALLILAVKANHEWLRRVCGSGIQGCLKTLGGPYSRILGLDLAWVGLAFFAVLLVLEVVAGRRPVALRLQGWLVLAGLVAFVALLALQLLVLKTLCSLCLFASVATLSLALSLRTNRVVLQLGFLLLPFVVWLGVRWHESQVWPRAAPDTLSLPSDLLPYVLVANSGDTGGHQVVILFDYACSHCRELTPGLLRLGREHPQTGLGLVYLPIFQDPASLAAARIAFAAQRRGTFLQTHEKLCHLLDRNIDPAGKVDQLLDPAGQGIYRSPEADRFVRAMGQLAEDKKVASLPHIYLDGRRLGSDLERLNGRL